MNKYTTDGGTSYCSKPSRSHAEKCPICNGRGWLYPQAFTSSDTATKTCHGCNGKGWVVVYD